MAAKKEESEKERTEVRKVVEKKTQITAENRHQKNPKKPYEPYQDILAFPNTGRVSLFKRMKYKVFVSIGLFRRTYDQLFVYLTLARFEIS